MKNLEFITKQIKSKNWTKDGRGKQDLDIPILSISTRYYPDFTAMPSFLLGDTDVDSDIDYKILLEPSDFIKGESEEDCKLKVKEWYVSNLENVIGKLLND